MDDLNNVLAKGKKQIKMDQNSAAQKKLAELMQTIRINSAVYRASVRAGFGVTFVATQDQFNKLVAAAEAIGLDIEIREYSEQNESKMEPGYQYKVFVYVPDDWK